jgi:DNA-binding transcriptional LysR family regulator
MESADLNALVVFAAVAEQRSFTGAAEQLGVAKAKVSLVVGRLEAQLGQTLFARTTRRVVLTEAGQALYEQGVPPVRAVQDVLARFGSGGELTGQLRIAAPVEYAGQTVAPCLPAFAERHPGLEIDVRASERVVDMLKEGIDVSLRLGWLRDSTLKAVKLGDFAQYLVASPAYLARAPKITQPADLATHEWVTLTLLPSALTWRFQSDRGQVRTVRVNGRLRTDSVLSLRGIVAAGWGLTVMDEFSAAQALRNGELVRVLPHWSLPRGGVHAVFAPGRHVPAKVRAFVDFFRERLQVVR